MTITFDTNKRYTILNDHIATQTERSVNELKYILNTILPNINMMMTYSAVGSELYMTDYNSILLSGKSLIGRKYTFFKKIKNIQRELLEILKCLPK